MMFENAKYYQFNSIQNQTKRLFEYNTNIKQLISRSMNINNKLVYIDPYPKHQSIDITKDIQEIREGASTTYQAYGMQFDTALQIKQSTYLALISLANICSLQLPSPTQIKNDIQAQFLKKDKLILEPCGINLKFTINGKTWIFDRRQRRFTESDPAVYLNKTYKTEFVFYPGLSRIKVGDETFNTKEPVYLFDSNQWAFAVGGKNHVEIFSNGKRYCYNVKPTKIKFGSRGLFIVDQNNRILNIQYQRYSDTNYNRMRTNKQIANYGNTFQLVSCGRVMFLVETDQRTYVRVSSVSLNVEGMGQINVNYNRRDVVSFGAFSENEQTIVVYFVSQCQGSTYYDQYKLSIKS